MEMKNIPILYVFILAMTILSCNNEPAIGEKDIVGLWKSSEGASFSFTKNGEFSGVFLPAQYFTFYTSKKDVIEKKINGKGHWRLTNGQKFLEMSISFDTINHQPILGSYTLFIAGNNGLFENKPPWYLFAWKDEEGGDRYKLFKQ